MKKYITSERPHLFEPNIYISVAVKIEGNVTAEMAVEAVRTAYTANESTMSKIVLCGNGSAYYEKQKESGCNIVIDSRGLKDIINDSEKKPFDLKKGELVRTFIRPENNGVTFVIHAHHLVGDGKSVVVLVNDILDSLDGKSPEIKPMLLIDSDYLEKRAKLPARVKLLVKHVNRKWAKTGKIFGWDDYDAIHRKYWNAHSSELEINTYSVSELKKRCANGTTLNSLLIAEMLKNSLEVKTAGIPVSIRENNDSMSNQTSGIAVKYRYNNRKSFEANLEQVHKRIYKKLNNANSRYFVLLFIAKLSQTLMDSVILNAYGCYDNPLSEKMSNIMGYTDKSSYDIGVTNLGKIDISAKYDSFKVDDVIFIPPKISYSKEVVGIGSYKDKLTVCRHKVSLN